MRSRTLLCVLAALALVGLLAVLVRWGQPLWSTFTDRDRLEVLVQRWGAWGPLVIIVLQVLQTLVAPVPGQVIGFVGGYLYGIGLGTLYCMAGTLLGTLLSLILVRRYGRPMVLRLADDETVARLDEWLGKRTMTSRRGELLLFLIFLFPFTPSDVANLVAGLTTLPIGRIMLLSAVGRFPGVLVPVLIGAGSVQLTAWQWAILIAGSIAAALLFLRYGERLEERVMGLITRIKDRAWRNQSSR